jgi:hypothetical protein
MIKKQSIKKGRPSLLSEGQTSVKMILTKNTAETEFFEKT